MSKLGSWYLLMIISVVLVTLVHRPRPYQAEEEPQKKRPTIWPGVSNRMSEAIRAYKNL